MVYVGIDDGKRLLRHKPVNRFILVVILLVWPAIWRRWWEGRIKFFYRVGSRRSEQLGRRRDAPTLHYFIFGWVVHCAADAIRLGDRAGVGIATQRGLQCLADHNAFLGGH